MSEWRWWVVLADAEAGFLWAICSYITVSAAVDIVGETEGLGYWTVVVAWLASAVLLVRWRRAEDLVVPWVHGLRRPTVTEQRQLEESWRPVVDRLGVTDEPFRLWVQESDQVTATALPGHTVAVTRWSLLMLPRDQLEAVMVHELAHHLVRERREGRLGSLGRWLGRLDLVVFWLSLPARGLVWAVRSVVPPLLRVPVVGCLVIGFFVLGVLGVVVQAMIFSDLNATKWLLPAGAPLLLAFVGRLMEYLADLLAADLGYGKALREAFTSWEAERFKRHGVESQRAFGLLTGAPAPSRRIVALDKHPAVD